MKKCLFSNSTLRPISVVVVTKIAIVTTVHINYYCNYNDTYVILSPRIVFQYAENEATASQSLTLSLSAGLL